MLFLLGLTLFRIAWIVSHQVPEHPQAKRGIVDLQDWRFGENDAITLDGEWMFYPNEFVIPASRSLKGGQFIDVPSSWEKTVQLSETMPTFGYGTYKLTILLPPTNEKLYGLRFKKMISASKVFINGELVAWQNEPVQLDKGYATERGPFMVLFPTDQQEVELVIHVSNYDVPFFGGIVDSIKIGSSYSILNESKKSITLQIVVCMIYLLHSLYAFCIYFFGKGKYKREVFYYGLLLIISGFAILIDDDIVLQLPTPVEWDYKLLLMLFLATLFVTVTFIKHLFELSSRMYNALVGLFVLLIVGTLILPFHLYTYLGVGIALFYGVGLFFLFIQTIKAVSTGFPDAIFILLFITSYTSNILWGTAIKLGFSNIPYYPFDFIIAIIMIGLLLVNRHIRVAKLNDLQTLELQKADKMKDDFLINTSHELRNPLHGILNITHSLLMDEREQLSAEQRKSLQLLLRVGKQMSFTINDLMDSTRIKEQKLQLNIQPVRLQSIASAVLDMMEFVIYDKKLELQMDIPNDFPAIQADENRLLQILFNLLHNAVKFTDEGTITLYAKHDGQMATISIHDTGIGIDDEFQKKIFNRYVQDNTNTAAIGGIGVGLSICKELVELQGGKISLTSKSGVGSTFSITLPLSENVNENNVQGQFLLDNEMLIDPRWQSDEESVLVNKPRVLVVDDDAVNLHVLRRLFQPLYFVTTAMNGKEALQLVDEFVFDIAIIDVMMPHLSGYELTKLIRKRFSLSELPIILLTARSQPEDILTGYLAGANDYVAKPMNALSMQSRVQVWTSLRQAVKEQSRMEAAWLQAQIQPHFLYNTLNTIASLADIDATRMTRLLNEFGNYLRKSFHTQNIDDVIPLTDELSLTKSYVYIEQERFGERLKVRWEIDEKEGLFIPPLALQTIVENAVSHGVLKRVEGGTVVIRIKRADTYYDVIVEDDGIGMSIEQVQQLMSDATKEEKGIGVANTQRRLRRLYGKGLVIESERGIGTTVKFQIPYIES
ncbi:ATP-binding protein [Sporosarcina sp. OR05]|uniref:ATP-binding protein n=1 Tax=Sporosarcina sp. OR05 TaxID=2969819 RepID=UPI00352A4AFA